MAETLRAPVVFFIFNRPDVTAKVFARIAEARPRRLYVVADGPRPDRPGEAALCDEARAIATNVTWPCDLAVNFADRNLGCGNRITSGIDWVFAREDEAIFLEDDCLPDPTFFRFCDDLLAHYRDDERIAAINGFRLYCAPPPECYSFSDYVIVWGWASWRRVWRRYDARLRDWPTVKSRFAELVPEPNVRRHFGTFFNAIHAGLIDLWSPQLQLVAWRHNQLSIIPRANLIRNLGFDARATHTTASHFRPFARPPTMPMRFPVVHPTVVARDVAYDAGFAPMWLGPGSMSAPAIGVDERATGAGRPTERT